MYQIILVCFLGSCFVWSHHRSIDYILPTVMKDRIVLITGANGFIGSHLVERFISEGYKVRGLVRKKFGLEFSPWYEAQLVYGDVTDPNS